MTKRLWDDSTGSAEMYNSFASGFPLVDIGKCVYYSTQGSLAGRWLNGNCESDPRAFVCELPATHADNCTYNYNGHCFTLHTERNTFVQAQAICEQECGNLASIHSSNENRYLSSIMSSIMNLSNSSVYIGASWPSSSVFNWLDGSNSDYTNIDQSFGHGGNCALLSNYQPSVVPMGYWFSFPCTAAVPFICKRSAGIKCSGTPPPVTVTPVPSNPSFCNSTLLIAPGVITSPNYPSNYDNNQFCSYHLSTLGSYRVLLHFSAFATEVNFDLVVVYNGESASSSQIGRYSGSLDPFSVVSTGNNMFVTFKTDGSGVAQGFSARFTSFTL